MKLLFDQNLSPRLVDRLADLFPDSSHVSLMGLDQASDVEVWNYARDHACTLVTKDADFSDMSALRGYPPKVIWLRLGNCTTRQIEELLRRNLEAIEQLAQDAGAGVLVLI